MRYRFVCPMLTTLAILAAPASGPLARAQRIEEAQKSSVWMKHKLIASQAILEGMTRCDFDLIEKTAHGLQVMDYLEARARADLPGYKAQLQAFDHAGGEIALAAREKNLDGVAIAYNQMIVSCVQCHKLIRNKPSR